MLARHAESLFWTGRYLERAEDTARMLDVTYHGLLESPPAQARGSWHDLLRVLSLDEAFDWDAHAADGAELAGAISEFLVLDQENPGAIGNAVLRARENVRSVRELVSTELWEAINGFWLELQRRDLHAELHTQPYELYGLVKRRCQMVSGVAAETMPRDDGWRFLMLGWMLERAEMTCRLINVRYAELADAGRPDSYHLLLGALKSASASEAYRKTYGASMRPVEVVEFLLLDRAFPRSVLYCLRQADKDLTRLPTTEDGDLNRPQRLIGRLKAELEYRDVSELLDEDLHGFLDRLQAGVREVADAVGSTYFRNAEALDLHAVDFHPAGGPPRTRWWSR
ncbi:MAG: alpha-E domain-containing protein [Acidimicrobiales bacterium]|nr:alpha-E domain-containing protein [Acidimicrobiales bacterium]